MHNISFELQIFCAFQRMNPVSFRWALRMLTQNCTPVSEELLKQCSKN